MTSEKPRRNTIDKHIGSRIAKRRVELNLSVAELAVGLGIHTEDLHKVEDGERSLTPAQIYDASLALSVLPSWFFEKWQPD